MNFKNILVISKWEIKRSKPKFNLNVTLLTLFLFASFTALFLFSVGMQSSGQVLYSAGISGEDRIINSALEYDRRFRLFYVDEEEGLDLLGTGGLDLLVVVSGEGTRVIYTDSEKSLAALDALSQALRVYRSMALWVVDEENVKYAFPLWIQPHYLKRAEEFQYFTSAFNEERGVEEAPVKKGLQEGEVSLKPSSLSNSEVVNLVERYRGSAADTKGISQEESRITLPAIFSPPLPFRSVLLTFLLAFPIYLFSQFYSSSMLEERTNRRAELLLTSPLRGEEVVAGKTLVHFLLALGSATAVALILIKRVEAEIILVLIPVILFFLSLSFLASLLSRSYKENSFIIIFISVIFFSFLFFPAMFVDIHTVSNISPVSMIVSVLEGGNVGVSQYIFTTFPLFAISAVLFFIGALMFREEVLFSQKSITHKIFYGINIMWERFEGRLACGVVFGIMAAIVAYMLELIFIVALFQVPFPYSLNLMITLSAFSEEAIKIAFVVGVVRYSKLSPGRTVLLGALCGLGFFIGEKLIALVTLSQIYNSLFGSVIFLGGYLFRTLMLHVMLTSASALGLVWSRGRVNRNFLLVLFLVSAAHLLYNYSVVGGIQ
ncbi:ABC transporter permease [Candidatus Pyrohabitans sp.]